MKFLFPILAILVCIGAAYFSLVQSEKFDGVQAERLTAIDTNKQVTANADAADVRIAEEEAILEQAKDDLAVVTQSVLALESTAGALKGDEAKLNTQIAQQDEEFLQLEKTLAEVQAAFEDLGEDIDIDNLGEKIAEMEEEVAAKKETDETLDSQIEKANVTLASNKGEVQRLVERKVARDKRISRNAMEARVTAVDQDWGFLVIGAGSNSGFTPQTTLLVRRDGKLIGKVSPSSIEPTQTIAEIDMDTLAPGVRIQPGDRVILAKPSAN